ncbi:MAG: hypothetical protein E7376_01975 [Clostridiales bacterium]|nr:hypothetical protein [Clostridiales bacterium]
MNALYTIKLKENFPKIYKQYLTKLLDEDSINQIFANKNVSKAFNKVLNLVYKNTTFGNKYNDEIKAAISEYEQTVQKEVGFNDEYLRQFFHIYRFYASSTYSAIIDEKDRYLINQEQGYFNQLSYVCCEACENLFNDLQHGNRWWEVDSPTTLRRQLMNDRLVIPVYRLQKLCREYLGREINIEKDLCLNEGKTVPPLGLVKELDEKMAKNGYSLAYAYVQEVNGQRQMVESSQKPNDDRYYIKRYVPTRETQNTK